MASKNVLLEQLSAFHTKIASQSSRLAQQLGPRITCHKGCHQCCVDNLTVFGIEAEQIRTHARHVLEDQAHPPGKCALLDEAGACRIYPWRPYVCRTQGLPLRFIEEEQGEWVEYRDICPLNEDGEPAIEELEEQQCWTLGQAEGELAELQRQYDSSMQRFHLRDLFKPVKPT